MAIFDLFSRRQRKLRGDVPDVYTYDELPRPLRIQLIHIWTEIIGDESKYSEYDSARENIRSTYQNIVKLLRKEYGVFKLSGANSHVPNPRVELFDFFLNEDNTDYLLDVVELCARVILRRVSDYSYRRRDDAEQIAREAIEEVNERFREFGIGYEYVNDEIIRIDSEFVHREVVKPALSLLQKPEYKGSQQEFLGAHEHFRKGNNKEALTDCLKSFESLMKAICDKRGWSYNKSDTAKNLIDVMLKKELVPQFWQTEFSALRSLLESSVPTGRNKLGGHGQGTKPTKVPDYLAAYMIHMTAAALVFLAKAEEALP